MGSTRPDAFDRLVPESSLKEAARGIGIDLALTPVLFWDIAQHRLDMGAATYPRWLTAGLTGHSLAHRRRLAHGFEVARVSPTRHTFEGDLDPTIGRISSGRA